MDVEAIKRKALEEIKEDEFKVAVSEYKKKLKEKKSFWDFIPYKIVLIKKEKI